MQGENQAPTELTRRSAIALAGAAGVTAAGAAAAKASPAPPGSGALPGSAAPAPTAARSLDSMFEEASAKYGVPRDVLAAVGYNESLFDNHGGQPSMSNGYGIMHLADNPTNRTLAEAGRLTGFSADRLCADDSCNILGAAAVLSARADQLGLSQANRGDVNAWHPVIASYPALADATTSDLYAQGAYLALQEGVAENGIVIAGHAVPAQFAETELIVPQTTPQEAPTVEFQAGTAAAAKPRVVWAPAYRGNYRAANRPRTYPIRYVVLHVTQGSYAGAISWFKNARARVSAHYTIRSRDGQITQSVSDINVAWHAGNAWYNNRSIGIEHEGYVSNPRWFTEAMYRSSANLTRHLCDKYRIPKTRSRIIGHNEVPRATHTDPGRHWNWSKYMRYVTGARPQMQTGDAWSRIIDSVDASGAWETGSTNAGKYGANYRYVRPAPVSDTAWFTADLPASGQYRVEAWYPSGSSYNTATPYVMATTSGNRTVRVDQRSGGRAWKDLGTFSFAEGRRRVVGVSRWTASSGWIVADAIRITQVG